ncbi:MAG: HAMP domain-containing protein, partial [Deltaproteobacteria bacterium]|nr:HAMP domain-containing protein [Deltaproteobacteria bacterium]
LWIALLAVWLAPLRRAVRLVRRGERPAGIVRDAAYRAMLRLPLRALGVRTLMWTSFGAGVGLLLMHYADWPTRRAIELASAATVMGLACSILRALWYAKLVSATRQRLFRRLAKIRLFSDRYRSQLHVVEMATAGGALAAALAFLYYSRAVTPAQFLDLVLALPAVGAFMTVAWLVASRLLAREVHRYLGEIEDDREPERPTQVYKRAQALPYRLTGLNLGLWALLATASTWFVRYHLRFELDDSVLVLGTIMIIGIGTSLYGLLWFRHIIQPVLEHLTVKHRLPVRGIRSGFSLRAKLLVSFGGLVLFSCSLALVWGFIQYKSLVSASVAKQAGLGMAWLRSEVQAASNGADTRPGPGLVRDVLAKVEGRGPEVNAFFYYLPADPEEPVTAVGASPAFSPPLPWYARAQSRLARDGPLRISSLALWGRHGRLDVRWRGQDIDLGSLAVLIPSYRARGPSIVRPLKELLVFFLALFAACAGIVVFTVAQVVTPIRRLEERADQMARGELAMPVSSAGEGDEVGRLTFALEEMRRALREKLRSTEEVNLDLERAVQRRTADLAKKNRELAETLQKLTRAQDQLVRSEKLASIGQLVAGIAHEINNPVNAIVNTVGPLQEAIDDANSDDGERRSEAAKDMRDMIRVVQNGARRTKDIVQALHNYSRTDEESMVSVDLNRSIDDSLELLRHLTKQSIDIERDYGDVGRIDGHAGQLNQVFMNLLTNAAQAIGGRDGAMIRIETEVTKDDAVEIRITDSGPGIPEEVLGRIFDPFFTTKDVGEGSGLGLSIVHGIVERHGGTIEVRSEAGRGTTFTLVLPRSPDRPLVRASTAL